MRLSIRERFACFSIDNKNYRFCFRLYSQICLIIQANVRFQGMHLKNVYKSGGIRIGIDIVAKLWKVFNESSASVKYQRRLDYSLARYSFLFHPLFSSSNHFWYIKSSTVQSVHGQILLHAFCPNNEKYLARQRNLSPRVKYLRVFLIVF